MSNHFGVLPHLIVRTRKSTSRKCTSRNVVCNEESWIQYVSMQLGKILPGVENQYFGRRTGRNINFKDYVSFVRLKIEEFKNLGILQSFQLITHLFTLHSLKLSKEAFYSKWVSNFAVTNLESSVTVSMGKRMILIAENILYSWQK